MPNDSGMHVAMDRSAIQAAFNARGQFVRDENGHYVIGVLLDEMMKRLEAVCDLSDVTPQLVTELWNFPQTVREMYHFGSTQYADDFEMELLLSVVKAIAEGRCSDPQSCAGVIKEFDSYNFVSKS